MDPLVTIRLSAKAILWERILGAIIGAAVIVLSLAFTVPLPLLFILVGLLVVAGFLLHSWIRQRIATYRLFPDRLEVDRGIFTRNIDNLELFRVRDVGLRQGVLGRLMNFGDVYVHSTDSTAPDVHLVGIDDPRGFYQQLRELVTQSRALHRTLIVEEGGVMPEGAGPHG
ncbi:MAG: PH domain-containing protein [Armatimonadetes bacterium]|nr:PH domain-containing protein [Armatimonadota bacterium]